MKKDKSEITLYHVSTGYMGMKSYSIQEVKAYSATDHYIWLTDTRGKSGRHTLFNSYFDTKKEAIDFIKKSITDKIHFNVAEIKDKENQNKWLEQEYQKITELEKNENNEKG